MKVLEAVAKTIYIDWAVGSVEWEKLILSERKPWLDTARRVCDTIELITNTV